MLNNKHKLYFLIAVSWTLVITILSLITIDSSVGSSIKLPNKDKYVHFTFYFVFVIVWSLFFRTNKSKLFIIFSAIGYGILMEICQGVFTVTRTPDFLDIIANSLGALFGIVFIFIYKKNKKTTTM